MTFISYAQNFEDVMLWRALKHVENGFYIDVGANDPTLYSVTRAFYERAWHGINIEPVAQFFIQLADERPRDINLQLAAGEAEGNLRFFDIPDSGLATLDANLAEGHRQSGWTVNEIEVPVLPLAEICKRHVTGEIHFLKIDVEGAEKRVLSGMDFRKWRPWIVVVEATIPMSQQTAYKEWESILTDSSYSFAYFDGLNRYYIAVEHADELSPAFSAPPNVFDGFVLHVEQELRLRVDDLQFREEELQLRAEELRSQAEEAQSLARQSAALTSSMEEKLHRTEERVQEDQAQLHTLAQLLDESRNALRAIHASTSWRITRPLRELKNVMQTPRAALKKLTAWRSSVKAFATNILGSMVRSLMARPHVRRSIINHLARFPALNKRAHTLKRRLLQHGGHSHDAKQPESRSPGAASVLSASARRVLADLERTMTRNSK